MIYFIAFVSSRIYGLLLGSHCVIAAAVHNGLDHACREKGIHFPDELNMQPLQPPRPRTRLHMQLALSKQSVGIDLCFGQQWEWSRHSSACVTFSSRELLCPTGHRNWLGHGNDHCWRGEIRAYEWTRLTNPWTTDVKVVIFRCLLGAWQFQMLIHFPPVKRGIRSWNKKLKNHFFEWARFQTFDGI